MTSTLNAPATSGDLEFGVANAQRILLQYASNAPKEQGLRELVHNALEELRSAARGGNVRVIEGEFAGQKVVQILDDGRGMLPENMIVHFNNLGSTGDEKYHGDDDDLTGNMGVGGKAANILHNLRGIVVDSWTDTTAARVWLWRNPQTRKVGLRTLGYDADGNALHTVDPGSKPDLIAARGTGTRVTLLGNNDDQDVTASWIADIVSDKWAVKYLNGRYFQMPEGIDVKAFEKGKTGRTAMRPIHGMKHYMGNEKYSSASGVLTVGGKVPARIHWFVSGEKSLPGGLCPGFGHVAALYQDELYEARYGTEGHARLRQFGVVLNAAKVTLYAEPLTDTGVTVHSNPMRTALVADKVELPWTEWAAEFKANLPEPIADLQRRSESATSNEVADLLTKVFRKLNLPFVKSSKGLPIGDSNGLLAPAGNGGEQPGKSKVERSKSKRTRVKVDSPDGKNKPEAPDKPGRGPKKTADPGTSAKGQETIPLWIPTVVWEKGEVLGLDNRPARLDREGNTLYLNTDYAAYTSQLNYWMEERGHSEGEAQVVLETVQRWYSTALISAINGVMRHHTPEEQDTLLSEDALVVAANGMYDLYTNISRSIGVMLGRQAKAQSDDELTLAN